MNFDKNAIFCELDNLPESNMNRYRLTCEADCKHKCTLIFESPKGPLFVYAEKAAGAFSLLCRKLAVADKDNVARVGQRNLISDADKEA